MSIESTGEFNFGASFDPLYNFKEQKFTLDYDVTSPYGNNPSVQLDVLVPGYTLERNITDNLDFLKERGFTTVTLTLVDGFGELFTDVPILLEKTHEGFDYDSQYEDPTDPDSGLIEGLDERTAKQRYFLLADITPFFASEAHKRGLKVDLNIESLAHIINRANETGIGGTQGEMVIAGNLPSPSLDEAALFLEQVKASILAYDPTVTDFTFFEEAYTDDYVAVITETSRRLGVSHRHTGPNVNGDGDVWAGYYYAFYPLSALQMDIYRFLITLSSTPPVESLTFGPARTMNKGRQMVVGHYTPWPADPNLGIEDLYDLSRTDEDLGFMPISSNDPVGPDGNPIETRTSGLQKNYMLYALIAERITDYFISVDLDPAFGDLARLNVTTDILPRLNEFAHVLKEPRPLVNVIIDHAVDQGNDRNEGDDAISDFSDVMPAVVQYAISEPIMAAISAAGFETWITYGHPLEGHEVDAYWIITAGGDEFVEEEDSTESPPLWTNADELSDDLLALIDPAQSDKPVIVSTMAGIPNSGNWQPVREIFGIPTGRGGTENGPAYASVNMMEDAAYQTSLVSSFLTDDQGELILDENGVDTHLDILPETIDWDGHPVRLRGLDPSGFGLFANVISPDEIPQENAMLASSRADGSDGISIHTLGSDGESAVTTQEKSVYIIRNGMDGTKILIDPNIYHYEMMYPLSNILCDITGRPRTMNRPSLAYVSSGLTTAVFALDSTEIDLNLAIEEEEVQLDTFDWAGNPIITGEVISKQALFPLSLSKHELAVIRPVQEETAVSNWMLWE